MKHTSLSTRMLTCNDRVVAVPAASGWTKGCAFGESRWLFRLSNQALGDQIAGAI